MENPPNKANKDKKSILKRAGVVLGVAALSTVATQDASAASMKKVDATKTGTEKNIDYVAPKTSNDSTTYTFAGLPASGSSVESPAVSPEPIEPGLEPVPPTEKMSKGEILEKDGKVKINLANYFETDKADIGQEDIKEITDLLKKYIGYINKQTLSQFLEGDAKLIGSSDPRKTNNWEKGNYGLTKARLQEVKKIILNLVDSDPDLLSDRFSQEEKEQIKNKLRGIELDIPMTFDETGAGENGVIDYHKIIDPRTGALFTDEGWKTLDSEPTLKQDIYQQMRQVSISLSIETVKNQKPEKDIYNPLAQIEDYKEVLLLVDASPSMKASKQALAQELENSQIGGIQRPVVIYTFTTGIEEVKTLSNQSEGAQALMQVKINENQDVELAVENIKRVLENVQPDSEKRILIMSTDEDLQGVSLSDIQQIKTLMKAKNVEVLYKIKAGETIYTLTHEDVEKLYQNKVLENKIADKILQMKHNIAIEQKYLEIAEAASDTRQIKERKTEIERLTKMLNQIDRVNIDKFSLEQ